MVSYSISENLIRSAESFGQRIVFESMIAPGEPSTLTYAALGEKVRNTAWFLSSIGVKKSDRVAIMLENGPEWAVIFFALAYVGAITVPLDPHMSEKDVKNIVSDSGAKLVLTSKDIKESVPPQGFKRVLTEPDDIMVLLYTSGTTDVPKGVMLTHKNLCANFYSLKKMRIFSTRDVVLSVLPLYHSYALMTTLIAPLFSGSRIVYVPADWPDRLVEYMKKAGTTVFIGVPQIYQMMHSRMMKKLGGAGVLAGLYIKVVTMLGLARIFLPGIRKAFGKRLRFFVSGGAKLDKTVAADFLRLGLKILEGYGLTETSPVASINPVRRPKVGSIGVPIPDVKMKIVNKNSDGVGEIAIQGPNVMRGYYKKDDKTREVMKDGWFLSGDLGYEAKDGYFYITGRSKEVIVLSSGKNIYPDEIEKHYSQTPYIKEICVLGVLKDKGGAKLEYLHAIVVPDLEFFKQRGEMNIRRVLQNTFDNLSKDIPTYRHIMGFTVTKEPLARTVLGKLKRYEIEKNFLPIILEEQRGEKIVSQEDEVLLETDTAKRLIGCLQETLDIKSPIHLSDSIELDLGVDSLTRVELVLAVEKCFDVEITDEMVAGGIFTVKDMLLRVEELLSKVHKSTSAQEHKKEEKAVLWSEILKQPLAEEFQKKILLRPDRIDYILTFLVKGLVSIFFRIFYNLRVTGAHRIPKKGPYVLCVNHTSFLDGFIVLAGVPFRTEMELFFIAFRRYFIFPVIRDLVKRARIIPIDATQIIEAMQGSGFILEQNKALCIFPEGERSIDGEVKEFKKGIGIIAKELGAALVPVYIKGAFEAWPRTKRFPRLYPIRITFGNPVSCEDLVKKGMALGSQDEYEAISLAVREAVIHAGRDVLRQ